MWFSPAHILGRYAYDNMLFSPFGITVFTYHSIFWLWKNFLVDAPTTCKTYCFCVSTLANKELNFVISFTLCFADSFDTLIAETVPLALQYASFSAQSLESINKKLQPSQNIVNNCLVVVVDSGKFHRAWSRP